MATLKINRGTTYTIGLTYKKNGVATSLVGATVRFTVKTSEYSSDMTDSDATLQKDVTDGTSEGEATITLDPADTKSLDPSAEYFYDIKIEEAGGEIYKVDEGTIELDGSPTNRGA